MLKTVVVVMVVVVVCGARPDQWEDQLGLYPADGADVLSVLPRAVSKPTKPNKILDAIVDGALGYIMKLRWNVSKRVQKGRSNLPFEVNSGGSSSESFTITGGKITGLGSLRRSKFATFNADETLLTGTVLVEDVRLLADYTVTFAGEGEAPAQTVSGRVTEREDKLFADITVQLKKLVPQKIVSYKVRSGHDVLESATNLEGNNMKPLHSAGFRKALREILEHTMATNMKVQINKAIQDLKAAGV